jgi:excisionase family DNA binding protein
MVRSVLLDKAAELLGVCRRTVYYRIRDGRLRTLRTACGSQRVLMESIEALLREEAAVRAGAWDGGRAAPVIEAMRIDGAVIDADETLPSETRRPDSRRSC